MNSSSKTLVQIYLTFGQNLWAWGDLTDIGIDHSELPSLSPLMGARTHPYYIWDNKECSNRISDKFVKDYEEGKLP